MNRYALLNIDYTWDFVADDGRLTCGKPGQAIEKAISRITRESAEAGQFIVFAVDVHHTDDPFHPESRLFPPHNIAGTQGRDFYGELQDVYLSLKEKEHVYYMDKTRYSAFAGTDLEMKLRERGIQEVRLCGVCTDICILHTAIDAYNKGFKIVIYQQAVASFNAAGHDWALGHFRHTLGAEFIDAVL